MSASSLDARSAGRRPAFAAGGGLIRAFRRRFNQRSCRTALHNRRMENMFDWNDLKAFLAVARGGSTLAASKSLNVNQTTVARRVEGLEAALGLKLFERGQSGSRLTEAGRDLLGGEGNMERMPGIIWMFEQAGGKAPASRSNTLTNVVAAVSAGLGVCALPSVIGDADPNLVRCSEVIEVGTSSAWIVTRREL